MNEEDSIINIMNEGDPITPYTPHEPPPDTHNNTIIIEPGGLYLLNMALVSLLALGIISACYKSVYRTHQYFSDFRSSSGSGSGSRQSASRQSGNLDDYLLSHQVREESDGTCSICIEPFTSSQTNIVLQCNHKFHSHCIKEWLDKELICPNCRGPINI